MENITRKLLLPVMRVQTYLFAKAQKMLLTACILSIEIFVTKLTQITQITYENTNPTTSKNFKINFACVTNKFIVLCYFFSNESQNIQKFISFFSKLIKTFHDTKLVTSIDYPTFDCDQLICSGLIDKTVRIYDLETNKQIQLFEGHSSEMTIKFIFWDIKDKQQLKILDRHKNSVCGIEFSSFNGSRYFCSESEETVYV
ncbi:hypothetical protein RFI_05096 [Reticulomyxa filosa]|uniref:Uncharacterized protein n=1 Tax=Reticulomyxa filosa TaxID=46433 RepID=X6P0D4_RETFI|nr:hypothetical protein RFI_05096 [Reticulomyxa filosa]|eukprot:ETO32020.1 hypothetical protein RFI_05096 [Reticulomyxa filosa]